IFQAAGGYAAAILAMPGQSANGGFQSYIGGWNLPFPLPWIGAMVAGGLLALPFTFLVGRRLRGDFAAVGLLVTAVLLTMLVTGGAIAGLSGGILVSYITTWSPAAWGYAETVVLFAAVIIGGAGNHLGAVLGAILLPVGFEEITRFIPSSNNLPPNLVPSLEWVAIGLLIVGFLWLRPQGILPERKRVIAMLVPGPPTPPGEGGARSAPRPGAPADV